MSSEIGPWIVTDERVPCLVLEGEIANSIGMSQIGAALKAAFGTFGNVYNRSAYQIDDSADVAFCFSSTGRAALLFFGRFEKSGGGPEEALIAHIRAHEMKIQSFFLSHALGTLRFERFSLETTGKSPN